MSDEYDPTGLDLAREIARAASSTHPIAKKKRSNYKNKTARVAKQPRTNSIVSVGNALNEVIDNRKWTKTIALHTMLNEWSSLVGAAIANHSVPESFKNGVLNVRTDSTAWATSLRLMAPEILFKLNKELGDNSVTKINIEGPSAPSWKHGLRSVRGRGPRDTYG